MKLALFCLLSVTAVTMANVLSRGLKNANDHFTYSMFSEIVREKPQQSVVMSPFSVLTPLAQLAVASEGESHDEILKAIGMPNDHFTKAAFSQNVQILKSVRGVDFKTANKVYIGNNYQLNEDFATSTRDVFNSEIQNIDFSQAQRAANEINSWVEDQTNKKIKDLVDPQSLDAATRAVLVNAIYFKGHWKIPFSPSATNHRPFYVTKNTSITIPMMSQASDFKYAEVRELDATILQLFYEGNDASMILVLPNEVDGITRLEEKLRDPSALNDAIYKMYSTKVEVTIPKFKIETTTDLKDVLSKMGVKKLFTPGQAHLSKLIEGEDELEISDAIQKAYIEVNEEGAEAAAANVFAVGFAADFIPEQPKRFLADRPFYFEIRLNDLIIFNGVKAN
ncbi:alaserpin-like [Pieris napi]|uniref:alaserpin-like n=1 Tax=Pieris napi TaxID=78633 RepID=UPI001FB8DA87|nr:alaserpin-like [Pieris napi]